MSADDRASDIKRKVQSQFGRAASDYAASEIHARGESLDWLEQHIETQSTWHVLDIATGAGHTAIRFAPAVSKVVASDITQEMLDQTAESAAAGGIVNLETCIADAEDLPFSDNQFDLVTCRLALHHFPNAGKAMREMARVLKPGGTLGFTDNFTSEDSLSAEIYNRFEQIRDPSHVVVRSLDELQRLFQNAGMQIEQQQLMSKSFEFHQWADRMRVDPSDKQTLLTMLQDIPDSLNDMMNPRWEAQTMYFDLWEVAWVASLATDPLE